MTITPQEARSRQTAYEATEHWWKSRLEKLSADMNACVRLAGTQSAADAFQSCAESIDALIAERTR